MSEQGGVPERYWFHALIATRLVVSEGARRRNPDVVSDVLRGALTVAVRPEFEALLANELIFEAMLGGAWERMLEYGQQAMAVVERPEGRMTYLLRNTRLHYALVLEKLGKYEEALQYLPEELYPDPIQLRVQAGQWVSVLLGMGERDTATIWLRRAFAALEEEDNPDARVYLERLAERL